MEILFWILMPCEVFSHDENHFDFALSWNLRNYINWSSSICGIFFSWVIFFPRIDSWTFFFLSNFLFIHHREFYITLATVTVTVKVRNDNNHHWRETDDDFVVVPWALYCNWLSTRYSLLSADSQDTGADLWPTSILHLRSPSSEKFTIC